MESSLDSVMRLLNAYRFSAAISVATRLGIPDLLADGSKTPDQLASLASVHAGPLHQILRASASCGVFTEDGFGRFSNTPMSNCLLTSAAGPGRHTALLMEVFMTTFGELMHSVRHGDSAFEKAYGQPFFDFLSANERLGTIFDSQMTTLYEREVDALLNSYDFSSSGRVLDVGGGRGTVMRALLSRYPRLQCGLFDLPAVAHRARDSFIADGLSDRCQVESGSFFEAIPTGYDTYILKHVLHDWDDAKCSVILANVHRAIGANGRLLVLEHIVPDGNQPSATKATDLLMLALLTGKERTEKEFRELLTTSGFELERIIPTDSLLNVLEARRS